MSERRDYFSHFVLIYINKISDLDTEVKELKKQYHFTEQVLNLKQDIAFLKKNKKGKQTDIEDFIKVVFLLIILYLLLKALGVII